jgi:hypothetical protein
VGPCPCSFSVASLPPLNHLPALILLVLLTDKLPQRPGTLAGGTMITPAMLEQMTHNQMVELLQAFGVQPMVGTGTAAPTPMRSEGGAYVGPDIHGEVCPRQGWELRREGRPPAAGAEAETRESGAGPGVQAGGSPLGPDPQGRNFRDRGRGEFEQWEDDDGLMKERTAPTSGAEWTSQHRASDFSPFSCRHHHSCSPPSPTPLHDPKRTTSYPRLSPHAPTSPTHPHHLTIPSAFLHSGPCSDPHHLSLPAPLYSVYPQAWQLSALSY